MATTNSEKNPTKVGGKSAGRRKNVPHLEVWHIFYLFLFIPLGTAPGMAILPMPGILLILCIILRI